MAPVVLLKKTSAASSALPPSSPLTDHASGPIPPSSSKSSSKNAITMPSNPTRTTSLTSLLARAWSSASSPLTPLPSPASLTDQIASSNPPPPVAARLVAALALNAPDFNYLSDLSDVLAHLSVWPSVVATAVFSPSLLPSPSPLPSSPTVLSATLSSLSALTISTDALSPTRSTATPLEQIDLGFSTGCTSRIPRTIQYSLAPGETSQLEYPVALGVKPKSPTSSKPRATRRTPASRPLKRPSPQDVDQLATITLGRAHSSLGTPTFSRRRTSSNLPQHSPSLERMIQSAAKVEARKSTDLLIDDINEVAPAVDDQHERTQHAAENGHGHDDVSQSLGGMDQFPKQQEDLLEDLGMDIEPVAPHEATEEQQVQALEGMQQDVLQGATKDGVIDNEAKSEDLIDLVEEEKVDHQREDDDGIVEVTPNGEERPVRPLKDKKVPNMGTYLSRIRNEKTEHEKKHMRFVPIDTSASVDDLPQAPDTAFARQERLKERKEKGRKQADAAKEKKKMVQARQQEIRKRLAKRKKKKAAKARGEVYVSSEEEDGGADVAEGPKERTDYVQDLDAEPISVDINSNVHRAFSTQTGMHDTNPHAHESNKRQRLNSPIPVHYRDRDGPPFHDQHFHGNAPRGGWSGDRGPPAPNGHHDGSSYGRMGHPPRSDYGRTQPHPPFGPLPQPAYTGNRFHPTHPSYPPPHQGAPYPPVPGNVPYPPHSQYPPPPGPPYPGPGYAPHGHPPSNNMYNANPQYGHPSYDRHAQAPLPGHSYYAERERLPRLTFNRKREALYKTIGKEYEDLTPDDGKAIDDFLDNQRYMFGPNEDEKDYVLQRRPGIQTILRIRKKDGVWSVVRLRT